MGTGNYKQLRVKTGFRTPETVPLFPSRALLEPLSFVVCSIGTSSLGYWYCVFAHLGVLRVKFPSPICFRPSYLPRVVVFLATVGARFRRTRLEA